MSKETTFLGILAFLSVLFPELLHQFDNDPDTIPNWNLVIAAFMTMLGLWRARDNNKTSEQVRAGGR